VITGSNKVQDGVIRLNYKAGEAAVEHIKQIRTRIKRISEELGVEEPDNHRETQRQLVDIFSVEPEQLEDTIQSFRNENDLLQHKIRKLERYLGEDLETYTLEGETVLDKAESLFETRKNREKQLEGLENDIEGFVREQVDNRVVEEEIPTENVGLLIQVARKLAKDIEGSVTLIGEKGAVSASYHEEFNADENLEKYSDKVKGGEEFAKAFDILNQ